MRWLGKLHLGSWVWRVTAALALGLGLVTAQAASAASGSTIMVLAPGAQLGAPVTVEWLDPSTHVWMPVSGWTGTLDQQTASGVPFKIWTVLPANYGQGPFRWVISMQNSNATTVGSASQTGGANMATTNTVWGTSSPFTLPVTDGQNLQFTVFAATLLRQVNNPIGTSTSGGNPNSAAATTATSTIVNLGCPHGCNASAIQASFIGLPATSWITVEWLSGNGAWEPVLGWQGLADSVDATSGTLTKQFGVYERNYGQGPFRWAVYNSQTGGSLLAVSPNFNLPGSDGQLMMMSLS